MLLSDSWDIHIESRGELGIAERFSIYFLRTLIEEVRLHPPTSFQGYEDLVKVGSPPSEYRFDKGRARYVVVVGRLTEDVRRLIDGILG